MSLRPRAAATPTPQRSQEGLSRALAAGLCLSKAPPIGVNPPPCQPCPPYQPCLHRGEMHAWKKWIQCITYANPVANDNPHYKLVLSYLHTPIVSLTPEKQTHLVAFYNNYIAMPLNRVSITQWPDTRMAGLILLAGDAADREKRMYNIGKGSATVGLVTTPVALGRSKRVLVVQCAWKPHHWMLPSGEIDEHHSSSEATAHDELREESGYRLSGVYPGNVTTHDPYTLEFVGKLTNPHNESVQPQSDRRGDHLFKVDNFNFNEVDRFAIFGLRSKAGQHGGGETKDYGFAEIDLPQLAAGNLVLKICDFKGNEKQTGGPPLRRGLAKTVRKLLDL